MTRSATTGPSVPGRTTVTTNRRRFLLGAAAASASGSVVVAARSAGSALGAPGSAAPAPQLRTFLDGERVTPDRIRAWEARRIPVAAARLARDYPGVARGELAALIDRGPAATADLGPARAVLARTRADLGVERIREMLAPEIAVSGAATLGALAISGGRWAIAATDIDCPRGTAEGFAAWFTRERDIDDRRTWTDACPDHYVIVTGADGRQEVIEVTGGAVLPSRFFVDYTDRARVPVPRDPGYPIEVAGTASVAGGDLIGGVRHQFRNLPGGGFRSRLRVAFPAAVPGLYITEHRWHLAVEFGNWISAYLRAG
ncbi:hypothetical protein [Tsukamurella sp. NPDC003166]|uniref:hypothetical protein n=1 Tax=Tsukamurella sp. NPDC003166 TaxID=3154444 RepID=UPI00339EAE14